MEHFLTYFLLGIGSAILMFYLNRGSSSRVPPNNNGQYVLRIHKFYYILSIASTFLGLFVATMIVLNDAPVFAAIIALSVSLGLGIPLFLLYKKHQLAFDKDCIQVENFWGKRQSIQWVDVQSISFNPFSGWLIISDGSGKKVKIHQHIVGLSTFIKMMEEKTTWTAKQLRLPFRH